MNSKVPFIVAIVFCIACAGGAGFFYLDSQSQSELIAKLTKERDAALEGQQDTQGKLDALQAKMKLLTQSSDGSYDEERLKQSLDSKDEEITRLKNELAKAQSRRNGRGERGERRGQGNDMRQRGQEFMQRMKEENPERYEKMMAAREEMQKRRKERNAKRESYLNNINLNKLNAEQRETVAAYKELTKENEALRNNMQEGDRDSFRQMMSNQREISAMSTQIRDILIEQVAGAATASEISNIIDATSDNGPGGRGNNGGLPPPPPMGE